MEMFKNLVNKSDFNSIEYAWTYKSNLNLIKNTRVHISDSSIIWHSKIRKIGFTFNKYGRVNKFELEYVTCKDLKKSDLKFKPHKHARVRKSYLNMKVATNFI